MENIDNNYKQEYLKKLEKTKERRNKRRIIFDAIRNSLTYIASFFSIVVLLGVISYCIINGSSTLSMEFITSPTIESNENYIMSKDDILISDSTFNYNPSKDEYFSSKWGVAFKNSTNSDGSYKLVVSYIDTSSPFLKLYNSRNLNQDELYLTHINNGDSIKSLIGVDKDNEDVEIYARNGAEVFATKLNKCVLITQAVVQVSRTGIIGPLLSTLLFILFALLISLPLGIGGAIYLGIYAKNNFITRAIRALIDMISGIPSIIFGLAGAIIFIPMFGGTGSIISGSFTLAVMVLPTLIKNIEESIKLIPTSLTHASIALGASQTQTVFKIIIPNSIKGILTGSLLSIGRIIGESSALVFACGVGIINSPNLNSGAASLAVYIWKIMQVENPNYQAASATALLILIIVLILNISVKFIAYKCDKFTPKKKSKLMTNIKNIFKKKKMVKE